MQVEIQELDNEISETAEQLKNEKKSKEEHQRFKVKLNKQREQMLKEYERKNEEKEKYLNMLELKKEEKVELENKLAELLKEKQLGEEELEYGYKKLKDAKTLNEDIVNKKNHLLEIKTTEN